MRAFACLLFAALTTLGTAAGAAPFAVRVGEVRIALEAPPGFADTGFTGSPRLQELAQGLTSASNRILLFAISDEDLRRFTQGDRPEFRRYLLVATPRAAEREWLTERDFQRTAQAALRGFEPLAPGDDFSRHLESQPVGMTVPLAELRREPAVVSLLQGTRLEPTKTPRLFGADVRQNFMLSSSTLLLVRGRVLHVHAFTLYETPQDEAWLRTVTASWIDELQRLNDR